MSSDKQMCYFSSCPQRYAWMKGISSLLGDPYDLDHISLFLSSFTLLWYERRGNKWDIKNIQSIFFFTIKTLLNVSLYNKANFCSLLATVNAMAGMNAANEHD